MTAMFHNAVIFIRLLSIYKNINNVAEVIINRLASVFIYAAKLGKF